MGQLSETSLEPFLRFNPASFDHMDHVSDRGYSATGEDRYGRDAGAGSELFPGNERISKCAAVDRCRRSGGSGNGLQPWDFADSQHADGDVAGLHAYENVSGGGHCGGHDQRSMGAATRGAQRQHRTW